MKVRELLEMLADKNPDDELVLEMSNVELEYLLQQREQVSDDDEDRARFEGVLYEVEVVEMQRSSWNNDDLHAHHGRIVALRPTWDVSPRAVVDIDLRRRDEFCEREIAINSEKSARAAVQAQADAVRSALQTMRTRPA